MLRKIIVFAVSIFLFVFVTFKVINEYFIDLQGISIRGFYECEGKRLTKFTLDKYYAPSEIWNMAQTQGYKGQLHIGFGEPDDEGSGLFVDIQTEDKNFGLLFGRTRDSNWEDVVVYSHRIGNSCLTPNAVLRREIVNILTTLGLDSKELNNLKFSHDYHIPWFTLPIL